MKRFISSILAFAVAASPAAADTRYYYRNVTSSFPPALGGTGGSTAPDGSTTSPGAGQNSQVAYASARYAPVAGSPFAVNLPVPAGVAVTAWRAVQALPAGIALDGTYGILQGVPEAGGSTSFVVNGYDSASRNTLALNVTLDVDAANIPTTSASASGRQSLALAPVSLEAPPGATVASWRVRSGNALPAGLSLSGATVTGTPVVSGTTRGIVFEGLDGSGAVSARALLDVALSAAPRIASVRGRVVPSTTQISILPQALDAVAPLTWSLGGALPQGLAFEAATGAITGSILQDGVNTTLTLSLRDNDGLVATSNPFVVGTATVYTGINAIPTMNAAVGNGFAVTFSTSNLKGTVAWSLDPSSAVLPDGLSMDAYGSLSGVPTKAGTYPGIVLKAISMADGTTAPSNAFAIVVRDPPQVASPGNLAMRTGKPVSASTAAAPTDRAYTYTLNGTLPAGMGLNPSTGTISGTPTATGLFANLSVTARDNYGLTATSDTFQAEVAQGLMATYPSPTPDFRQGRANAYSPSPANAVGAVTYAVAATGNDQSCGYNWYYGQWTRLPYTGSGSCYSGALPAGLSLDPATGTISGTPASPMSWWVQVRARDADGSATTVGLAGPIAARHTLSYAPSTAGAPNAPLTVTPSLAKAIGPVAYALTPDSGSLPAGVTLKPDGTVSGSTPTTGVYLFSVDAKDSDGLVSTSNQVRIAVSNQPDIYVPAIPAAKVGKPFALTATAGNLVGAATWTAPTGLPAGLAFSAGAITGTPTTAASYSFSLTVKDTRNVPTTVGPFTVAVATGNVIAFASPAKWRQGLASAGALSITNAVGTVTWTATGLPAGLALTQDGKIGGTPLVSGSFTAAVTATDSEGTVATLSVPVSVEGGLALTYGGNKTLFPNESVNVLPTLGGLQGTAAYAILSGGLPDGLILNADGSITGTAPQSAPPASVVIGVTDSDGARATASLVLAVTASDFVISVDTAPAGQAYQLFTLQPYALLRTQTVQQYVAWTLVGPLPDGLRFDTITGLISGTPTTPGTASLRLKAVYADKSATSGLITLTVAERPALTASFPAASSTVRRNVAFALQPSAAGQMGNVRWSVTSGVLPPGLTLNDMTGLVSGSPTANGTYAITLRASDANRTAVTGTYTLTVSEGMTASVTTVTTANRVGKTYLATADVDVASGPVTWTLVGGVMPGGLALKGNPDGRSASVSGAPTADGTSVVTLRATDSAMATSDVSLTVSVGRAPTVQQVPPLTVASGQVLSYAAVAQDAAPTANWSWDPATTPPDGLTVAPNGTVSGTLTGAATYSQLRLKVVDGDGLAASSNPFTVTVSASASPQVTLPSSLQVVRGQPTRVAPIVTGIPGTPTYALEAYNSYYSTCSSGGYNAPNWRAFNVGGCSSPSYVSSQNFNLPAGLNFDTATGVISGTPLYAVPAYDANSTAPTAYRVKATVGSSVYYSNQMTLANSDWVNPTLSAPSSLSLVRGQPFSMAPTAKNVTGSVTYALEAYNSYYSTCSSGGYNAPNWRAFNVGGCSSASYVSSQNFNLPAGLSLDTATGVISGTPLYAVPAYDANSTAPPAYRIKMTETRTVNGVAQALVAYSNEITVTNSDWQQPGVTLPSTQVVARGQPVTIYPTTKGVTGSVTYALEAYNSYYNGCSNSYYNGSDWRPFNTSGCSSPSYVSYQSFNLPAGLTFDTSTGIISGTPQNAFVAYDLNSTAPAAFRIKMTETRVVNGTSQVNTVYSNQMVLTAQDWTQPAITLDETVSLQRGRFASIEPTVTGVTGTVTYALEGYNSYYNGCTNSYYNAAAWRPYSTSGCNLNASYPSYQSFNLPAGLTFDTSTGIISGTPQNPYAAYDSFSQAPSAFRIKVTESRKVGSTTQVNTVYSNQMTLGVTDWQQPSLTFPSDTDLVKGTFIKLSPVPKNVTGSVTYALEAYNSYYNGCSNSYYNGSDWRPFNTSGCSSPSYVSYQNFNLPGGLTFDAATGVIQGTPTRATLAYDLNSTAPPAFRIKMTETRVVNGTSQVNTVYSNQFVFRGNSTAPTAPTLDYGNPVIAVGVPVNILPKLTGATTPGAFAATFNTGGVVTTNPGERVASALPAGLRIDPATGALIGTVVPGAVTYSTVATGASPNVGTYRGIQVCAPTENGKACDSEVVITVTERSPITIDSQPYPTGSVGAFFGLTPQVGGVANGSLSYTLLFQQGTAGDDPAGERKLSNLPANLSFANGSITGTPAVSGTYRGYAIRVQDGDGYRAFTKEIVIRLQPQAPLALSAPAALDVTVGKAMAPFAATPTGLVGTLVPAAAPRYNAAGLTQSNDRVVSSLPPGLSYDPATGLVSGVPGYAGSGLNYRGYNLCAKDDRNVTACTDEITIRVAPAPAFAMQVGSALNATVQDIPVTPIAATPANALGTFAYASALRFLQPGGVDGQNGERFINRLPAGLTYDAANGRIVGTPTDTPGRYRGYQICGTDSGSGGATACTPEIVIDVAARAAFTLSAPAVVDLQVGKPMTALTPSMSGNSGAVSFAAALTFRSPSGVPSTTEHFDGTLPSGLTYSAGTIQGAPATETTTSGVTTRYRGYRVCATDALGRSACTDEIVFTVR